MKTFNRILVLIFILLITNVQLKPQQQIKSGVLANGGTSVSNETNRVVGTIGQPMIGRKNNQTHIVRAGFWEQTSSLITDVRSVDEKILPKEFYLYQNYPNPFNPSTKISWQSPVSSWQTLKVYDILGNEVATLVNEFKPAGSYEVEFSAKGGQAVGSLQLASGIYFYKIQVYPAASETGGFTETKKMILLR
jgi:hypothetical protein